MNYKLYFSTSFLAIALVLSACTNDSKDDKDLMEPDPIASPDPAPIANPCVASDTAVYAEKDGRVIVEAESIVSIPSEWEIKNTIEGATGTGYIVAQQDNFNTPGKGTLAYIIKITTPGVYRFLWRSRITEGDSNTDKNDNWLRINDAQDFYAQKEESIVYPKGTGKTPNPEGSSADGWFKIYMNNANNWLWRASTFDNDPHVVYANFETAGNYTIEISSRSAGHGIDKFLLYKDDMYTEANATKDVVQSETTCE